MFDIAWSEMVVIGAVALIAIGPKDLPKALRAVGAMTAKARRMATEFQDHFREAMREAELESVKQEVANIHQDLSSATSGLQGEFNSIGAQLPNSSEPAVPPVPGAVEAAPLASAEPASATAGKADAISPEASATGGGATKPANTEPAAKLSVEAAPAAVIVTETASPSSTEKPIAGKPVAEEPIGEKPLRKKRAASRSKAKSDTPAQANLEIEPAPSTEARPKPRKRAAKALPSGDDRAV
jgi:sec-independent protein translocase protein TatB